MATGQGRARIEFEADASGVSNELVAKMTATMDRIAAILEKGFSQGASKAEASLDGVGTAADQAGRKAEQAGTSARKMGTEAAAGAKQGQSAASGTASAMDAVSRSAEKAGTAALGVGTQAQAGARTGTSAATGLGRAMDRAAQSATSAGSAAASSFTSASQAAGTAASSASRAGDAAGRAAGKMATVGSSGRAGFEGASSAAQGLIGKLGGITLALGAVMGPMQMLKGGFDRLMNLQRAEIMFQNVGLSAQETKDHMARLSEQVTGTSVSLADAAKYSAMFAQSGVDMGKPMDDSIKAFTSLASIAEGSGVDVGRVLQQISANGTVTGEDLAQMSDAGVNASKYLADSMGIAQSDIKKAVSDGKVTFEDFVTAINHGTGDLAKQMGQTLPAKISNLKTSVSSLGAFLIEPFIGPITATVEFSTALFKNIKKPLAEMGAWLSGGSVAADVFKVAVAAIGAAAVVGGVMALARSIDLAAKAAVFGAKVMRILSLSFLLSPIGLASAAIGGLVAAFVILWNKSDGFRAFWTGLWDGIVAKVTGVVDTLKAAWGEITAVFRGGDDGYGALQSLIGAGAAKWVLDTLDTVRIAWGELTAAFRGGDDGYGALAALIGQDAAEWAVTVIGNVKAAWGELTSAFSGGDDGYGALGAIIGMDTAEWAVNALASVKTAWTELTTAFTGGDDGYGALEQIVGTDTAQTIVNAIAGIGDGLRQTWELAKQFGTTLFNAIGGLLPVVSDLVASLGGALWSNLKTFIGAVIQVASSIWGLIQAIAPVLLPALKVLAGILGGALFVAFKVLTAAIKVMGGVIQVAAGVFSWLIGTILTPLVSFLIDVVAGAFTLIVGVVTGVATGVQTVWNGLWGLLQAAWDTVGRPVLDIIVSAFNLWWEGVQLVFRLFSAAYEVLFTGIGMAWDAWGRPVLDFIVAAFQLWWSGIEVIFGWLKSGWDLLWSGIRIVYDSVIAPVIGWIKDRFEDLHSGVSSAMSRVREVIQTVADRIAAFYDSYIAPFVDRVVRGFGLILDTVTGWKDTIVGALSGAGSWLVDAGKNVVQGFINGIKSLAGTIGDAFLNLVPGWIKDPFKKALGIASPSKLFAGFGVNIGEGLINGLQSMQGRISGALGGVTQTAVGVGDELREAFTGGDSGYAALGTVIGDDLARTAVNAAAGAGQTAATVGAAGQEATAAFQGRDMGYAATGALIGDDAAVQALNVSEQIGGAFSAAGEGINAAKSGVIDPALAGMSANLAGLGVAAAEQGMAVTTALTAAGAGVANAKATLVDPALAGMQAGLAQTAAVTQQQMLGMALPAMQSAGAGVAAVQTGVVDPALSAMRGAVGNTASAFGTGVSSMNTEMNKLREGTAAPVRFTVGVFNDGIVNMWNGVADMIGAKKMAPHPVGFAIGTSNIGSVLPGYTPGRDPYTFIEPRTGMQIGLSGGEAIMRPEVTRALGTDRVDNLNAAARMGGVSAVKRSLGQFAGGGVVDSIVGLVNRYFPGMSITSTYRNSNDHHGQGLAVDFSNGSDTTPQMQAAARFFHQNYAKGLLELIHYPLNGWQNIDNGVPYDFGPVTNSQHRNHVHVAAARPLPPPGGLVVPVPSGAGAAPIDWAAMVGEMIKPQADEMRARIGGTSFPGIVGELPGKTYEAMLKPMQATIVKKMEESGGSMGAGGGGAEQWRGLAMQALARHGYNPAQHIDAMLKQIQIESGGVPNAINNWDSNAAAGHPSGGLLQVIEPTYRRVRNAYPEAFVGLPDNHMIPATNLVAGVGAVRMDWGGPQGRWPTTGGYDQGGIADGMGFLQKKIVQPERVLSPVQTKAFEAWMAAGQRFDEINDLMASVQAMRLDRPEVMADDIARRVSQWIGSNPADGSLRALAGALQSGVEWERVTQGMARSAEAWANGDWVQVAEDKRLATPDEMRRQVEGNFLAELTDELGGLIGLSGLMPAPKLVDDTGLVTLPKDTADKLDAAVSTPDGAVPTVAVPAGVTVSDELAQATRIGATTPTGVVAGGDTTSGGEKVTQVDITVNVNGTTDPMAVSDQVVSRISRGLQTAIGGTVRSQ